jgi:predicted ATP-binding protein involved in virulence
MTLSSGYQALIRIFCEILFFSDCMKVQRLEKGIVVIDEIDEYLSPKYSAEILNFLHDEFSNIHFIVTTHSLDLVETTENATIIVINKCTYATYTSEFLRDTVSANDIFTNLFFENRKLHVSDNDDMDNQLRQYLNSKVAGMWDEKMQEELEQINLEDLKPHQRLIFKQIKEW